MDQDIQIVENKLKNSFSNIKKDILSLRSEMDNINTSLEQIKTILTKENFLSSTGNEGVINNHQQSTIINTPQQHMETPKDDQLQPYEPPSSYEEPPRQSISHHQDNQTIITNTLNNLKKELEKTFKGLTDREFSIFLTIYELEHQIGKVTYADIAHQLSLTEMTIRSYVSSLINKNVPIEKTRRFNNKVSLSIKKELKELDLASKLISLRTNGPNQQTLFSNY